MADIINDGSDMTPGQAAKTFDGIRGKSDEAWAMWIRLGHFIIKRKSTAASQAGGNTHGDTYNRKLEKLLGAFKPAYDKMNGNGTMTGLMKVMGKLDEVQALRDRMNNSDAAPEPPNHPTRMFAVYEQSLMSTTDHQDEDEADDDEDDDKKPGKDRSKKGHNREKELLAQIAALRIDIARLKEEYELTGDEHNDADRLFRRIVREYGHSENTAEWAKRLADELKQLGENVLAKEAEWSDAAKPLPDVNNAWMEEEEEEEDQA